MSLLRGAALFLTFALFGGQAVTAFPREGAICLQNQLTELGYTPGAVDGLIGAQTRAAAKAWQDAEQVGEDARFPELTQVTALQWCREIGLMKDSARAFWPSQKDVRTLIDTPVQDAKTVLVDNAMRAVRAYYAQHFDIWLAGSYDVVGAENGQGLRDLLRGSRRDRALEIEITREHMYCVENGLIGIAYPKTMAMCLNPMKAGTSQASYPSQSNDLFTLAAHEFMHLIQLELSNFHDLDRYLNASGMAEFGPEWMVEGGAEYFMYDFLAQHTGDDPWTIEQVAEAGNREGASLRELRRSGTLTTNARYDLSHYAVKVLVERYGEESHFAYWHALGRLGHQDAAFQDTFGMSLDAFEREFAQLRQEAPGAKHISSDRTKGDARGRRSSGTAAN